MGQCVPFSETSEILWKKSNVFRKISDVFQKISNVFGKKSNVFAARSEVGTLVGGFWDANAGQKEESEHWGRKLAASRGRCPLFQPFNQPKIAMMCGLCKNMSERRA